MKKQSSKKKSASRPRSAGSNRLVPIPSTKVSANGEAALVAAVAADLAKAKANEVVHVPFGAEDVGGEMVAIASEGLYGDPRDALREYVQNSVDAGAEKVSVVLSASSAKIEDDGGGMPLDVLLRARQFAKSSKSSLSSVGFRGIGIYAGFPMCNALRVETQVGGAKIGHTLTFDFKWMRERLRAERIARPGSQRTSLPDLMTQGTSVAAHRVTPNVRGKTTVHLEGLSDHAVTELADFGKLRQYLVDTLPVGYAPFEGRETVEKFLRENVPDYRTVQVTLKNTVTKADVSVTREYPSNLGLPVFLKAIDPKSKTPQTRAVVWASLVDPKDSKHPGTGLLYKSRGFTIGDQDRTRRLFVTRQTVVNWMVGEIWVVDPAVTPNAARNDFEATQPRRTLEAALQTPIESLKKVTVFNNGLTRADKVFDDIERDLPAVEKAAAKGDYAAFDAARFKYYKLLDDFQNQRFKEKLPSFAGFTKSSVDAMTKQFTALAKKLTKRQGAIAIRLASVDVEFNTRFRPSEDAAEQSRDESGTTRSDGSQPAATSAGPSTEMPASTTDRSGGTPNLTGTSAGETSPQDGGGSAKTTAGSKPADTSATRAQQLTLSGVLLGAGVSVPKALRPSLDALAAALDETLTANDLGKVLANWRRRLGAR